MNKRISKRGVCVFAAVGIILVLAGVACGLFYQRASAPVCVISLDINPSIELRLNQNEKVISCTALNEEAAEVLSSMDGGADLKDAGWEVAVNAIVGSLVKYGYMNGSYPAILISVEDDNQERAAQIRQELIDSVTTVLQEQGAEATVFSQILKKDAGLEQQARQNDISIGKAALAARAVTLDNTLEYEQVIGLSVEELIEIGSSVVSASQSGVQDISSNQENIIGADGNSEQRESSAQQESVIGTERNPEQNERDTQPEIGGGSDAGLEQNENSAQPTDGSGDIGETPAKLIALEHAGLSESQVTNMRIERDYDRSRLEYEVEFWQDMTEYEYTIDGISGAILECKKNPHGDSGHASIADNDIGEEAAKSIALSNAGLSENQVTDMRVQRQSHGNALEYEIKFKQGGMRYEYVLDGSDGAILEYEWND